MIDLEPLKKLINEYQNKRNDGWVTSGYKEELIAIRNMIDTALSKE